MNALEKLGYTVDSSATPHIQWREPEIIIDHRKAPEQPYYPDFHKLTQPLPDSQHRPLLQVPVTVKPRLFRSQPRWFRPWLASVAQMKEIAHYHMRKYAHKPILVLNMMFHSMEVIPKASPYPQTDDEAKRYVDDMVAVLDWCRSEGMTFAGLSDFYQAYTAKQRVT